MNTSRLSIAVSVLAVGGVIAGCGGGDSKDSKSSDSGSNASAQKSYGSSKASTGGGGAKLALAADPGGKIAYDKKSLQGKAGTNTIDFTNQSQVPHAVEVEGNGVEEETKTVTGGKASLTVKLKPGKYTFYCPVDDHRKEGMEGTLTVK